MSQPLDWLDAFLPKLRCPNTKEALSRSDDGNWLINASGTLKYPVVAGIPHLLPNSSEPADDKIRA